MKENNILHENGILLDVLTVNEIPLNGQLGWYIVDENYLRLYRWVYKDDFSGIYKLVEGTSLYHSTGNAGETWLPGKRIWKFIGLKEGQGQIKFELYHKNETIPVKTDIIKIKVVKEIK